MANKFERGDIVVMKSGGPPMTVGKVPGDSKGFGSTPLENYHCEWFKGATAQNGYFAEHLLKMYEAPK